MSYLRAGDVDDAAFPSFAAMKDALGFIPNLFRAQVLRPDLIDAEANLVWAVLLREGALARAQKEYVFLVCSAANLSTYCVTAHCEIVRMLGLHGPEPEQIAIDYARSSLSTTDKALLAFASKLNAQPTKIGAPDVEELRTHGFSEQQILETVVVVALAKFANLVGEGLGTVPDFDPARIAQILNREPPAPPSVNLSASEVRQTRKSPAEDPDLMVVRKVRAGDVDAFEELVVRHERRVFRTLLGITGNEADAEDGSQRTFLKAFEHLGGFAGTSTFATWLTRIAINEGLERVRSRKTHEPLPEETPEGEPFRPRHLQAWDDDPETAYAKTELRAIVEREVLSLPAPYRTAVLLRDLQELTTDEAAAALGLPVPTLKTHLLRGRMMLREALAPYFTSRSSEVRRA